MDIVAFLAGFFFFPALYGIYLIVSAIHWRFSRDNRRNWYTAEEWKSGVKKRVFWR